MHIHLQCIPLVFCDKYSNTFTSHRIFDKFSNSILFFIKKESPEIISQWNFINRHFSSYFQPRNLPNFNCTTNLDSQMYLFFFLYTTTFLFLILLLCLSLHACTRLSIRFKSYRSSFSFQSSYLPACLPIVENLLPNANIRDPKCFVTFFPK